MKKLKFEYLPLDKIDISVSNVRKSNLEEGIDELANSIREIGVQQPVVVFQKEDRYELLIGQRRLLACKKLGLREIPALITIVKDETDATIKSFSENIHRLELEYRDKMQVATELLNKFSSVNKVAEHLGVSPQTVRNYLGYAAVPEPIKKMVDEGKLSASTATRIAKNISDEKKAVKIAEKIKETPRSEDRRKIIDVERENPQKTPAEIVKTVKEQKFKRVTIDLTPRVADALEQACQKYKSDAEDITMEALEDWLKRRGFIK
ncbi:MAG: ParB/RepB/Spo0J family partition protein [Candidatus Aminicenantes bacterium]|nr:ParB/RepB/Spo0J family partition protein [Candidatus Aminicenantes bacterium]